MHLRAKHTSNIFLYLFWKLSIAFLIYILAGIFFYLFNKNYFSDPDFGELINILVKSLRYDLSALFMVNLPFIVFSSLPFKFIYNKTYKLANLLIFYYVFNILALFLNFIDIAYFGYSLKRSTADFLIYVNNEGKEIFSLIPEYFRDFGFEIFTFALLTILLVLLSSWIKFTQSEVKTSKIAFHIRRSVYFVLIFIFSLIMIRGGFQLKPINNTTAAKNTAYKNIPLVLNTPFSIIKTINQPVLAKKHYYPDDSLIHIYTPLHISSDTTTQSTNKKNIVLIILESFTAEYIESLNPNYLNKPGYQGFTPFLDSLMQHSIYFKAYANGKRSIEALPAILAGLPILMNTDFLTSPYANNRIEGLASILAKNNYHTAFFHGGRNGTMGFDVFTRISGFHEYYGRDEYNNDDDYDGKWGIYDEEFLQYFANTLNTFSQPFFGAVFTLSSHHPYTIPEKYEGKFREGPLKIHKSIGYTDYALKRFFETAKEMPWYQNTVFIITADHTSETYLPENNNIISNYEIPLIIHNPADSLEGYSGTIAQQADIMPTVLSILKIKHPYIAFGNDLLMNDSLHFALSFLDGIYQFVKGDFVIYFDGEKVKSVHFRDTSNMTYSDLPDLNSDTIKESTKVLKAIIQQYNKRMINNRLFVKN